MITAVRELLLSLNERTKGARTAVNMEVSRTAVLLLSVSALAVSLGSSSRGPVTVDSWPAPGTSHGTEVAPQCDIGADDRRIDCHPERNALPEVCAKRGCCWKVPAEHSAASNVPWCFYPASYVGYKVEGIERTNERIKIQLHRQTPSGIDADIQDVSVQVVFYGPDVARIVFLDPYTPRYWPPVPPIVEKTYAGPLRYRVNVTTQGALSIHRLDSQDTQVFRTDLSLLVFTDQFLQVPLLLPSSQVYGLGERYAPLMRPMNWANYYFFNRDREPVPNVNLYGAHPMYLCLEDEGTAHGVFLHNSNAMDVLLQPTPAAIFRTLGGILDFFVFMGPTPAAVVQQYQGVVGFPAMPPYWGLGFHLCRFGYRSLNRTKEIMRNNIRAGIPLDVQWNDIDYMHHRNDFTYDTVKFEGLPQFVDELHAEGRHYVMIFDPAISGSEAPASYPPYDDGIAMDIFVKNITGGVVYGKVWNAVSSVFPDFSHPEAAVYWTKQFRRFHHQVGFDGAWIDMNEPSNFYNGHKDGCPRGSKLENPPYVPSGEPLASRTLCMTDRHNISQHYNVHNIYGYLEAVATYKALVSVRQKRPFIISRSTFSGQGVWSGHWTGDIASSWKDMRATIPAMLSFGMYGIPLVGADICGFNGNTTVELCARWQALGAFYPFSRNHNTDNGIDQDPYSLGPVVVEAAKKSLNIRYTLLPYLYTLFYRSHVFGETVARPVFFEFPRDNNTYRIDEQFMWGPAILINPALYQNQTHVRAYVPAATWYSPAPLINPVGKYMDFRAPMSDVPMLIRGGHVLPLQVASQTTSQSRTNPVLLFVAPDESGIATGQLFWDDGESLGTAENGQYSFYEFVLVKDVLEVTCVQRGYDDGLLLGIVRVLGVTAAPRSATVAGRNATIKYDEENSMVDIVIPDGGQAMDEDFTIFWS